LNRSHRAKSDSRRCDNYFSDYVYLAVGAGGRSGTALSILIFNLPPSGTYTAVQWPSSVGGAVIATAGQMICANRHEFTGTKWYNFVGCCRSVMRQRSECPLIVFLNILLSVLDDLWSLRDQNSVFSVKSSYPRCVMVVPSIMIRGDDLIDLLFAVLIDTLGGCRGG